ncbi:MAG: hypothetical protein M3Y37_10180, partial [Chloroflexota bacterium]|nr:hypothetical protein [Chloroflexota bacterium]
MVIRLAEANRTERVVRNPLHDMRYVARALGSEVRDVHLRLPGYAPTPLIDLPVIARELALDR